MKGGPTPVNVTTLLVIFTTVQDLLIAIMSVYDRLVLFVQHGVTQQFQKTWKILIVPHMYVKMIA